MLSQHEIVVEVRDNLLPMVEKIHDRSSKLFSQTVGNTGPQGLCGPHTDMSTALQYLRGTINYLRAIAEEMDIKIPDDYRKDMALKFIHKDVLKAFDDASKNPTISKKDLKKMLADFVDVYIWN